MVSQQSFSIEGEQNHEFDIPDNRLIVLMVSALDPSKRVNAGIEAVSQIPNGHLVVAGDGPLRRSDCRSRRKIFAAYLHCYRLLLSECRPYTGQQTFSCIFLRRNFSVTNF